MMLLLATYLQIIMTFNLLRALGIIRFKWIWER